MERNLLERRYVELINYFKILSSNAVRNDDKNKAQICYYIVKRLDTIREQRHLAIIGSKDEKRTKYQHILDLLDNNLSIEQLALIILQKFSKEKFEKTKEEGR